MNLEEKILDGDETFRNNMYEMIIRAFTDERNDKDICDYIRRKLEEKDVGKWNVVVGKDFGSHVVHTSKSYGYWKLGEMFVLIWRSG